MKDDLLLGLISYPAAGQTKLDEQLAPLKWRNIGPFRGGRSLTTWGQPEVGAGRLPLRAKYEGSLNPQLAALTKALQEAGRGLIR
jgi:hypothetical protein